MSNLVCGLVVVGVFGGGAIRWGFWVVMWGSVRAMFSGVSGIGSGMVCFAGFCVLGVSVMVVLFSCVFLGDV